MHTIHTSQNITLTSYVLKRTYAMRNLRNVRLPQIMDDVISSIGIGTAATDSIGYRAAARYRPNPIHNA